MYHVMFARESVLQPFARMPVVAASSFEIPASPYRAHADRGGGAADRLYGGVIGDVRCRICACVRGWGVCERSSRLFSFWQSKEWSEARGVPDLHKWSRWRLGGPFENAMDLPFLARDLSGEGSDLREPLLRQDEEGREDDCVLRMRLLRDDDDVASQISSDDSFATDEGGVVLHSPSMLLEMASPCHESPVTSNSMCSELRFPMEAEEDSVCLPPVQQDRLYLPPVQQDRLYLPPEQQDRLYLPPPAEALPVPPRVPLQPLNVVTEVVEDSPRCSLVGVDSPRKPWPWQRGRK